MVEGNSQACRTADETYQAAKDLVHAARKRGLANDDCILDPGIAPIGSDAEGNLKRLLDALELVRQDDDLAGVHASVGL